MIDARRVAARSRRWVEAPGSRRQAAALGGVLLFMGTLHFLVPRAFVKLIPGWLPGSPRLWIFFSGTWELSSGALLLYPRYTRAGGYAAAATIIAVFPGNIKMAVDAGAPNHLNPILAWLRLPLQAPLLVWALKQTRPAPD